MHRDRRPKWERIHPHDHDHDHEHEHDHERDREHLSQLFHVEDTRGLDLFVMLQRTAHVAELLDAHLGEDLGLSGSRWMLLLRLYMEECRGNSTGLTPTMLSHFRRLSKNTISALLRGLEAQGLIERTLDPDDLRAFRIHLTQAGRDYVRDTAPGRMQSLNRLLSGLSRQEQEQLVDLLDKLQHSLLEQGHPSVGGADLAAAPSDSPNQECIHL